MEKNKRLDINSVYFHGLESWGFQDRLENSLKRLEAILKSKAILCRQKQLELFGESKEQASMFERYETQKYNLNGMTHVSICQSGHFDDPRFASAAFNEYIRGNFGIGIILSKDVESLIDGSRTEVMDGEFQVKGEIPLDYMVGIYCGCKSTNEILEDIESANNYEMSREEFEKILPLIFTPFHEQILQALQILLKKYGHNKVPIYSNRDWTEIKKGITPMELFDQKQAQNKEPQQE